MRRIAFICGAVLSIASGARASTSCQQTPQGALCVSQVDFAKFAAQAFQDQLQSQWCWAASIAMIFNYYGHPVSQARIVSDVYGAPVNMPAQAGIVMANELNRTWQDDAGKGFHSQVTGAYDAQYGVYGLTNQQIVNELDGDHPLVIGARTHAVVVTEIQYFATPWGPNVVSVGVFDPWPGVGARTLAQDEMTPAHLGGSLFFAATVRVADAAASSRTTGGGGTAAAPLTPSPPPPPPAVGCSTSGAGGTPVVALLIALGIGRWRRLASRT